MQSVLKKFVKRPGAHKRYMIDYSEWLDTGETISSGTFIITPYGQLAVTSSSIDPTGKIISFFVNGGNDGATYEVVVTAITSGGQTEVNSLLFSVRN